MALPSRTDIRLLLCDILKRDGAFHFLACEDGLIFPLHEDLDVGRHGGALSACGPTAVFGVADLQIWLRDRGIEEDHELSMLGAGFIVDTGSGSC